jgi:hypothetical protein
MMMMLETLAMLATVLVMQVQQVMLVPVMLVPVTARLHKRT